MLDFIDKALAYAARKHSNQTRKDTQQTPYIYHPAMCGMYLLYNKYPDNLVVAAILHDTVEDTDATLQEIEQLFGKTVRDLVEYQTEDKSQSWEDRKQTQINGILNYPIEAVYVKLADKLQNISCTYKDMQAGEKPFANMNRGYDKQKWYFVGLLTSFSTRSELLDEPMFFEFEKIVNAIFL